MLVTEALSMLRLAESLLLQARRVLVLLGFWCVTGNKKARLIKTGLFYIKAWRLFTRM